MRSVALQLRNKWAGIVRDNPPVSVVTKIRKELDVTRVAQVPKMEDVGGDDLWEKKLLELPAKRARIAYVDHGARPGGGRGERAAGPSGSRRTCTRRLTRFI